MTVAHGNTASFTDVKKPGYKFIGWSKDYYNIPHFSPRTKYINNIGMSNIERRVKYLRRYLVNRLDEIPYIKIYNKE